ncbi:methyl-accepting chemotaxis protein [Aestuariispira insulae]|uniref:Methyl-accepting chemotaxis protein n=1 Tax=Aestuariispira insulae TaxID=1461337 RepID=A0A3D9HXC6_9PROT|nr:methyl-accepting chemotaxis protein [Aestuariispira insulae]RED54070.1 methyl-accepting chemotaxis protein [Aestuariispira insulae]
MTEDPQIRALLDQWLGLSEMQRRTFSALVNEVRTTSDLVEASADTLSGEFQKLAGVTRSQATNLAEVIEKASRTEVDGKEIAVRALMEQMLGDLENMVEKVLFISKQGIHVTNSLQDLVGHIDAVDDSINRIEDFTRQTNYLAVNAKLEAAKAGEAGKGFSVVAGEIASMSKSINSLSEDIRTRMSGVVDGLDKGRDLVRELNAIDMSDNIVLKEKIEKVLHVLLDQNDKLNETVKGSLNETETITKSIGELTTTMQFQDRTKQRMEHIVDILEVLAGASADLSETTRNECPDLKTVELDEAWVRGLLDRFLLDEVKQRFISHVLMDGTFDDVDNSTGRGVEHASASDDIELF